MELPSETIVAVSSPLGGSPRAIVRLSGSDALPAALAHFAPDHPIPPQATYRAFRGAVNLRRGALSARLPALLFLMRSPRSYTREDVVELHVAGNPPVVEELLAALCREGARPAGPGEFTARAFASGRLDLAQAEAVMAVVSASGERSLAAAHRLLEGRLSDEVRALAARLGDLLARVELAIDFSQEDVPLVSAAEASRAAAGLRDAVVALSRRSRDVAHLDGDLRVALVGRPNVGKSSLFNRLAGAERAIVTDVAGTTRDELREAFILAGSRFVLSDTAGLADALADLDGGAQLKVERAARRHTLAALARAEVVLVVTEAGRMIDCPAARDDVRRLLATLAAPAILVVNKCDLLPGGTGGAAADETVRVLRDATRDVRIVRASALAGQGIDELRAAMVEALHLGDVDRSAEGPAVAARHRRCLESAAEALERAVELCAAVGGEDGWHGDTPHAERPDGPPGEIMATPCPERARTGAVSPCHPDRLDEELLALELREALDALGGITGETSPQDILGAIFARFCIGK